MRGEEDPLLTRREVAYMCGVGGETVDRWAKRGKFTDYFTATGQRRYLESEIRRMLLGDFPIKASERIEQGLPL